MALNDIIFTRNKAGLGAPLISKDHISGIIFYNATLPTGFSANEREKTFFSLEEAEDAGIVEGSAAHSVEWYHIREFFQKNPKGELKVGIYDIPGVAATHDFVEIETIQSFANGEIRQLGIYYPIAAFDVALVNAVQAKVDVVKAQHQPLNVLLSADISAVTDLSTLPDLRTLSANNVSVLIGQDAGGKGAALYLSEGASISDLGAKLGAVSFANVHECIAWIEKFPMVTDGTEFDVLGFANGDTYKETSSGLISSLDDKGYLFLLKHTNLTGSFNNDSYTATASSEDLATIENNRVIDKAVRLVRTFVLPKLASPLYVNADGTLTEDTIAIFKSLSDKGLLQMEADGELSASQTIINPSQDVLATSTLEITIELVPVGVARSIKINIGFTPKLS